MPGMLHCTFLRSLSADPTPRNLALPTIAPPRSHRPLVVQFLSFSVRPPQVKARQTWSLQTMLQARRKPFLLAQPPIPRFPSRPLLEARPQLLSPRVNLLNTSFNSLRQQTLPVPLGSPAAVPLSAQFARCPPTFRLPTEPPQPSQSP